MLPIIAFLVVILVVSALFVSLLSKNISEVNQLIEKYDEEGLMFDPHTPIVKIPEINSPETEKRYSLTDLFEIRRKKRKRQNKSKVKKQSAQFKTKRRGIEKSKHSDE